jgi:carbamoyltransferase
MTHAYWGPEFSNDQIKISLDNLRLSYTQSSDIAGDMAKRISQGEIIGWFQGKSEIGPRALGSRSILANPLEESTKDRLNDAVKYREPWRPFAPSILEQHAADYLVDPLIHPFMILTFDVVESIAAQIPAVVHIDRTVRPQTVKQSDNPLYYRLIQEFQNITGAPMVLNTSFNVKGEPVVHSVEDAVRCFYGSGLNSAAIGDFILEKPS